MTDFVLLKLYLLIFQWFGSHFISELLGSTRVPMSRVMWNPQIEPESRLGIFISSEVQSAQRRNVMWPPHPPTLQDRGIRLERGFGVSANRITGKLMTRRGEGQLELCPVTLISEGGDPLTLSEEEKYKNNPETFY